MSADIRRGRATRTLLVAADYAALSAEWRPKLSKSNFRGCGKIKKRRHERRRGNSRCPTQWAATVIVTGRRARLRGR